MNRKIFKEEMKRENGIVDTKLFEQAIEASSELSRSCSEFLGQDYLTIVIEELAELMQEILSFNKIDNDNTGILEEYTDLKIVMTRLFCNFNIYDIHNELYIYIIRTQKLITKYFRNHNNLTDEELLDFVFDLKANLNIIDIMIKEILPKGTLNEEDVNKAINIKCKAFMKKLKAIKDKEKGEK